MAMNKYLQNVMFEKKGKLFFCIFSGKIFSKANIVYCHRGLDMSPYSLGNEGKEGALYDLFAITNHSGTVNFGHYTSYGRLPPDTESEKNGLKGDGLGTI